MPSAAWATPTSLDIASAANYLYARNLVYPKKLLLLLLLKELLSWRRINCLRSPKETVQKTPSIATVSEVIGYWMSLLFQVPRGRYWRYGCSLTYLLSDALLYYVAALRHGRMLLLFLDLSCAAVLRHSCLLLPLSIADPMF